MNTIIFPTKASTETCPYTITFADRLQVGETISSVDVTISVFSGSDLLGPALTLTSSSFSGSDITIVLQDGVDGSIYLVSIAVTSSSSTIYVKEGCLAVVAANMY